MEPMMLDDVTADDLRPMDATDRCDACGAQAYVRVTLSTGELNFCYHHWQKSEDRLVTQALAIRDETEKLLVRP